MPEKIDVSKVREFFKSNVVIDQVEEIMNLKPESLIGIDTISSEKLKQANIHTLADLAKLSSETPPEVSGVLAQSVIKWIKIVKVLEKFVKEQIKAQKKLLLIGLDNVGKSSILAVLQDKFSVVRDLLPTRGVKREKLEFFGYPIISWDMGGQVVFRENLYFNKPELFFAEVDLVIYVIDSQDTNRFTESANYFKEVLKALSDLKEFPPIIVVFNKSDQDVRKTLQWQKSIASAKAKFDLVLKDYEKFTADYCDTSIFDKNTIMSMFSMALKKISETSEVIEHILQDFSTQIKAKAISLISMDGLIFGSYCKSDTDEILINNTALLLQTLSNFHTSIGLVREKDITLQLPLNKLAIQGVKLYEYSDLQIPVYLWILTEDLQKNKERIDYFKEQLVPLINLFL